MARATQELPLFDAPDDAASLATVHATGEPTEQSGERDADDGDSTAPPSWKESCTNTECTLHQLSPYIGKLKSSIASDIIERCSKPGDLVVDPFAGSGTILLEAALLGRHVFASDISPYAKLLCTAKLKAPQNLEQALALANSALAQMEEPRDVEGDAGAEAPDWVKQFFHASTLAEVQKFTRICQQPEHEFLFACLMGILHHQRPGFLSYPSSHLTPYLRTKKYPREEFPEMYQRRELKPRLLAKVKRAFKRRPQVRNGLPLQIHQSSMVNLRLPDEFDCLITSPPYMNALDYGRDNRLRLWFIDSQSTMPMENGAEQEKQVFLGAIRHLADQVEARLRKQGHCVLIVGEKTQRKMAAHPAEMTMGIFKERAPSLKLKHVLTDDIPDVRRSRRECRGVKTEKFLVFQKRG